MTQHQPASEVELRLAIKECRLRESYAIRNLKDIAEGVNARGWNDNLRRDYSFWKHEEELSRALKQRCEKLLNLDSAGFEMHTFECLCSLDALLAHRHCTADGKHSAECVMEQLLIYRGLHTVPEFYASGLTPTLNKPERETET